MAANRNSTFRRGSAVFNCDCCGRRTRETGVQSIGIGLCPQCYELAGIENELSDGNATLEERREEITALLAAIKSKGGSMKNWIDIIGQLEAAPPAPESPTTCPVCTCKLRSPNYCSSCGYRAAV